MQLRHSARNYKAVARAPLTTLQEMSRTREQRQSTGFLSHTLSFLRQIAASVKHSIALIT